MESRPKKMDNIPNPEYYFASRTDMFMLFKEEDRKLYTDTVPFLPVNWKTYYKPTTKKRKFLAPDEIYVFKSKIGVYMYMKGLGGLYSEEELERVKNSLSSAVRKQME